MESIIDRFCDKFASFDKLEGRNLEFYTDDCQQTYKNDALKVNPDYKQYFKPC